MAKPNDSSARAGLLELATRAPWWVAVAFGLAGFLVLHQAARWVAVDAAHPAPTLLAMAQYLLPLIGGIVAVASIWRRRSAPAPLSGPLRRDCELRIAAALRHQGYQLIEPVAGVAEAAGAAPLLRKNRETYLLEVRHCNVPKIGLEAVQQMATLMTARGATGGFMLTSGRFSRRATAFATGCNIQLLDGSALQRLLGPAASLNPPHPEPVPLPGR